MEEKYSYHIIVVDDNVAILQTLRLILGSRFSKVATISNPQMIQGILSAGDVDVVLLDMNFAANSFDGGEGLFWLQRIKERKNPPAVILMTAFGEIELAVESMKNGADDFITKPWNNEDLIRKILVAVEKRNIEKWEQNEEIEPLPSLASVEKERIAATLKSVDRNITKAAELLGISRRTLYNKIEKYGL